MARWCFSYNTFSPTAVADNTNFSADAFMAIQGGTSTQRIDLWELCVGGQSSTPAAKLMLFARDSQVGAAAFSKNAAAKDAPLDPATVALAAPPTTFTNSGAAKPRRSTTLGLLNLTINAFGGYARWYAGDPWSAVRMLGNTASFGEVSFTGFTGSGTGNVGAHIIYEPL